MDDSKEAGTETERKKKEWSMPKEASQNERLSAMFGRLALVLGVIFLIWLVISRATHVLFTPLLEIESVVSPIEPEPGSRRARLALEVRNVRFKEGAGYVVAVVDGESEVEGPIVIVPGRETVQIPVEVDLAPGRHVAALILYDAWRENVRVDARYGIAVRSGSSAVRAADPVLPAEVASGDTFLVSFSAANYGEISQQILPLVVVTPVDTGPSVEFEGKVSHRVSPSETVAVTLEVRTENLPPGSYHLALVFLDGSGEKTGSGLYRIPLEIRGR